jgi:Arc/MetJ-type ribon-helix-helix transcriptional regulator
MPSSYNLPELVKKEIEALVKSGYYSSKSDVVKDALRYMLENKKNLRLAASVELYMSGEISLGKAAEMADMSVIEYKERLRDFGMTRAIEAESAKKMDIELARIKRKHG